MDLGACVVLSFLAVAVGVVLFHLHAQDRARRADLEALYQRQHRLEQEQRATRARVDEVQRTADDTTTARLMAESAVYTAQRAEENAIAARALVEDIPPKRLA